MKLRMKIVGAAMAGAALSIGTAGTAQAQPAAEQPAATPDAPAAKPPRPYNLSKAEEKAFRPVLLAVQARDWAAATAALPAAATAATGADARYLVGQIRLQIGVGTGDERVQAQGVDEMIASGGARPEEMIPLYGNQRKFALAAGDTAKAESAQAKMDALNPNDPTRFVRQARERTAANDFPGAIALYRDAMKLQQSNGQPIPIEWRQQIAVLAYRGRLPEAIGSMRELLAAAPKPAAWHDALTVYGELGNADSALKLDIYRLMRAAGGMTGERDYIILAEAANEVRTFGEIKSVLEEGQSRNLITAANSAYARERIALANVRIASDRGSLEGERKVALAGSDGAAALRLGDAYFGYGEHAKAAELYRAALEKGGTDSNLARTRLGAALALAGRKAEAEAAFRAVTGPRAELAQFWLLWLSTRP